MTHLARRTRALVTSTALAVAMVIAPVSTNDADAISGFNKWKWGNAGYTLSSSSYKYSNMSGFWQAVLNSNNCDVAVDGIYGNITTWYTAVFQNALFGGNNGGVMSPTYLNDFHRATSVHGYRLAYIGYTDGYGTKHYSYYGGSAANNNNLGWNPISSTWLFSQHPNSNPNSLVPATTSRTIGSVAACS